MSKLIRTFTAIPIELFRLNNGSSVRLRDRNVKPTGSYDLVTVGGKVKPKALDPKSYAGSAALVRFIGDWKADGYQPQMAPLYAQIQSPKIYSSTVSKAPMSLCTLFQQVCTAYRDSIESDQPFTRDSTSR